MNKMTEEEKKDTTNAEGTTKEKLKEPDTVIEVRHTSYSAKKDDIIGKVEDSVESTTETTEKSVKEDVTPETGKEDKVETPQLSVKELEEQLATEKKKREGLELIVEAEATKQFETEKTEFLDLIKDKDRKADISEKVGDNPEILMEYKRMSSFLTTMLEKAGVKVTEKPETTTEDGKETTEETVTGEGDATGATEKTEETTTEDDDKTPEKTVSGRAVLPQTKETGVVADSYKNYIDELYAILKDPTKTAGEKTIADKQVGALFAEVLRGMKTTGKLAYLPPMSGCPNCNTMLSDAANQTCPNCGWKHMKQGIRTR